MWEPAEHRYFADCVAPLLGDDAVYVGEVGGERKLRLLADAEALVNPIRWPEPFGLVMIEAMACGTPVLAFPEGAAPEIVAHGMTGFLCADEHDMATHLELVRMIDRRRCRDRVETQFSTRRMVGSYLRLYRRAISESADPPRGTLRRQAVVCAVRHVSTPCAGRLRRTSGRSLSVGLRPGAGGAGSDGVRRDEHRRAHRARLAHRVFAGRRIEPVIRPDPFHFRSISN